MQRQAYFWKKYYMQPFVSSQLNQYLFNWKEKRHNVANWLLLLKSVPELSGWCCLWGGVSTFSWIQLT